MPRVLKVHRSFCQLVNNRMQCLCGMVLTEAQTTRHSRTWELVTCGHCLKERDSKFHLDVLGLDVPRGTKESTDGN